MGQFVTLYRDKNGGAYYLNQSQVAVSKSHYFIGYIIVVFALFLQFLVWLIFYRKLGWLKGGIIFVILAYLFGALLHLS
jgi:hypothetical protein